METLNLNRTLQIPIKENDIFQIWDLLQEMAVLNDCGFDSEIGVIYDMLKCYVKEYPELAETTIDTVKTITELIRAISSSRIEIQNLLEKTKKVAATVSDLQ